MIASFAQETIIRLRYPTILDHGAERPDYAATPAELPIEGCWLEPVDSVEIVDGRLAVSTGYRLAAPEGSDLLATDHVRYGGVEYDIDGDALHVPSPTGALAHVQAKLTRWKG